MRLAALVLALCCAAPARASPPEVLLSGVLFDGTRPGAPEPEEAVRITNTDRTRPADLSGVFFSSGPPRRVVQMKVILPEGTILAPGASLWLAHRGDGFREVFGYPPDFEAVDTLPDVPNARATRGWPDLPANRGVAVLYDAEGLPLDLVAYDRAKDGHDPRLPKALWWGPPVYVGKTDLIGWTGRILARDRTSDGRLQPDSDSHYDWDSAFSRHQLGRDEVHRIELPGQTHRTARTRRVRARVTAASSPENAYGVLEQAIREARTEVLLHVYEFKHELLADELIRARKRGVKVLVYLEGSPVGGLSDGERHVVERLLEAEVPVLFLGTKIDDKYTRIRYRFDHSKYVVVDAKTAVIGSENYGYTGMPIDPSYGNRGWVIRIDEPGFSKELRSIFLDDSSLPYPDLVTPDENPNDRYGLPYKQKDFVPDRAVRKGKYNRRLAPRTATETMELELVACPDTCMDEKAAVLGLIGSADRELLVIQNSAPLHWGTGKDNLRETPNLPLAATLAAARRGVRTRVLLDSTWYNVERSDKRDNDDTCRYLNAIARKEELDLYCKVAGLRAMHLEKIHTKGIVADGARVLVSSINWSENSFKGNREIGVVVGSKKIASYYRELFLKDWTDSRIYRRSAGPKGASLKLERGKGSKRTPGAHLDVVTELFDALEVKIGDGAIARVSKREVSGLPLVDAEESRRLYGRKVQAEGKVYAVEVDAKGAWLHLGEEPHRDLSVRVTEQVFSQLGLGRAEVERRLLGRLVRARGKLFSKGGPALEVDDPKLFEVVDGRAHR